MSWRTYRRINGFKPVAFEDRPGPRIDFVYRTERSVKVKCSVCGRDGYGPARQDARMEDDLASSYAPWQLRCLMGHGQCPRGCGRWVAVKLDLTPRAHTRCVK